MLRIDPHRSWRTFAYTKNVVTLGTLQMRFEWDDTKNRRNLAKHKISFETAKLVFDDPHVVVREDRVVEGEMRWQALGLIGGVVVVLVVHTHREEKGEEVIRIISARKAARPEGKAYDEAHEEAG